MNDVIACKKLSGSSRDHGMEPGIRQPGLKERDASERVVSNSEVAVS
jgi:hypothetical protein